MSGTGNRRIQDFLDRMRANGDSVYAGIDEWRGTPVIDAEGHYVQYDKGQKLLVLIPSSWNPQLSYEYFDPASTDPREEDEEDDSPDGSSEESTAEVQAAEAAFGYPNQEMWKRDDAPKALGRLITLANSKWLEFEVPNEALEKSGTMHAYITVTSEHHTMTEFIIRINVFPRVKPQPYQSLNDPDSVAKVLAMLVDARDRAERAAEESEDWAKWSKRYAIGDESVEAGSSTDNSKYYYQQAKSQKDLAASYASQAASSASSAASSASTAASKAAAAASSASDASDAASAAQLAAQKAKGWAVGPSGAGDGSDTNNAKYWAEQAAQTAGAASGLPARVTALEQCCQDVQQYIPPPFKLAIENSKYGYKDTSNVFHPFKYPSGTLTLTANTGSSGVSTDNPSAGDGAYYEKVVVDVPAGPGPTVHTTTYTPLVENDSGSGNDMGASHAHRYVNTTGLYKVDQGTKTITANTGSSGEDVTHYSKVIVDVPSSGITPTGTLPITANGTYDVTQYASADVNVPAASTPDYLGTIHNMYVYGYSSYSRRSDDGIYKYLQGDSNNGLYLGTRKLVDFMDMNSVITRGTSKQINSAYDPFLPVDISDANQYKATCGECNAFFRDMYTFMCVYMPNTYIVTFYFNPMSDSDSVNASGILVTNFNDPPAGTDFRRLDLQYNSVPTDVTDTALKQRYENLKQEVNNVNKNLFILLHPFSTTIGNLIHIGNTGSYSVTSSLIRKNTGTPSNGAHCTHFLLNRQSKKYYIDLFRETYADADSTLSSYRSRSQSRTNVTPVYCLYDTFGSAY